MDPARLALVCDVAAKLACSRSYFAFDQEVMKGAVEAAEFLIAYAESRLKDAPAAPGTEPETNGRRT